VNAHVSHSFPDFIEGWNRKVYRKVGYGMLQVVVLFVKARHTRVINKDCINNIIPSQQA